MRLPWPFGRSQAAPAETEPTIDAGPTPFDAAVPPAFPGVDVAAPPTGAWSRLPPIQRVTGDPPLVAPASTFLEDVPGANQLPPIIGQLGHDVTPLAPAGLVAAPVHPVPSLTSNASLVPRPVQRHASEAEAEPAVESEPAPPDPQVQRSPATSPSPTAAAAAVAPAGPRPATSAEPAAAPIPAATPFVEEPIRHLSVVAPEATSDVPTRSLTRADAWTPPSAAERPLAHRTNVQTSGARPATTASSTTAASASRPALSAPATTAPTTATSSPDDGPAARPVRRAGLGAPLAVAPSTAVQRTSSGGAPGGRPGGIDAGQRSPDLTLNPLAGASPLSTSVQRRGAAARSAAAGGDGTAATPLVPDRAGSRQAPFVGSPRSGGVPSLPVVSRSAMHEAVDATGDPTSPPAPGQAVTERSAAGPRPSMPLVGSTATAAADVRAASIASAQRARAATPPASEAPGRRPLVGAHPLGPSLASSAGDGGAAPTAAEPPYPATSGSGEGTVLWSNPLVNVTSPFPAVQRDPAADAFGSPAIAGAQRPALIPATAHVQPSRREAGPMTLARPQAAITAALAAQDGGGATSGRATGQASTGAIAGPSNTTMVQMTPAQALATPVIAPTATAVVQRADGAPPPADADEGEEKSDSELEDLARAIFPRIQRQLRMQYVYEREARGLPFDP